MKKIILVASLMASFSAMADIAPPPRLKPVPIAKMTLLCATEASVFWLGPQVNEIWVSDPGNQHEGFELSDVVVKTYRCPNTYKMVGSKVFGSEKAVYTVSTHGCGGREINGSVTVTDSLGKIIVKSMDLKCKRTDRI